MSARELVRDRAAFILYQKIRGTARKNGKLASKWPVISAGIEILHNTRLDSLVRFGYDGVCQDF